MMFKINILAQMSLSGAYEVCPQCLPLCNDILHDTEAASAPLRHDLNLTQNVNGSSTIW